MRRLLLLLLGGAAVVCGAHLLRVPPRPNALVAKLPPSDAPPASAVAAIAAGAPKPKAGEPVIMRDAAAVFQRAFWRRPDGRVRILGAERREWLDAQSSVQKWQWFVAVGKSAEFQRWLLEQNPFELGPATTPLDSAELADAPSWFPAASRWSEFTAYRGRGNELVVLLDPASGELFASARGGGFAAPIR